VDWQALQKEEVKPMNNKNDGICSLHRFPTRHGNIEIS
jgi:hypothetical protein